MNEYPVHILIVENEPISRHQLPSHFEKEGYAVTGTANAYGVMERTS